MVLKKAILLIVGLLFGVFVWLPVSEAGTWESKGELVGCDLHSVAEAPDGTVWVTGRDKRDGKYYNVLLHWDGDRWIEKFSEKNYGAAFGGVTISKDGEVFFYERHSKYKSIVIMRWKDGELIKENDNHFDVQSDEYIYVSGFIADTDGSVWLEVSANARIWHKGQYHDGPIVYQIRGSEWHRKSQWPTHLPRRPLTEGPAGFRWISGYKDSFGNIRWGISGTLLGLQIHNGTEWVTQKSYSVPDRLYITDLALTGDGTGLWVVAECATAPYCGRLYKFNFGHFTVTPDSRPDGKLGVCPHFMDVPVSRTVIQRSTDGRNFHDYYTSTNGSVERFSPTSNDYWFRLKWQPGVAHGFSWSMPTYYSNSVYVFAITSPPALSVETGVQEWSKDRGRSWVRLNWNSLVGAEGYKLHVFDGYRYRTRDLGKVTSWDSRAAKIFPYPSELPENNSVSSDIFRWDGSGLDLEDTAIRLYRTTAGTQYDTRNNYWFRVTAYNKWMETDLWDSKASYVGTLPSATDKQAPSGTVEIIWDKSQDVAESGIAAEVTVTAQDDQSGVRKIELSNNNVEYVTVYEAPLQGDGGTGIQSKTLTQQWTLPPGIETRTVYARITDAVGNQTIVTDAVSVGYELLTDIRQRVAAVPPVILDVRGLGGVTATTRPDGAFQVTVQLFGATHYRAGTSPGEGDPVPAGQPATVYLRPGLNVIYIEAWNEALPDVKAYGQMTAFRL
jgi:hypothetical protein